MNFSLAIGYRVPVVDLRKTDVEPGRSYHWLRNLRAEAFQITFMDSKISLPSFKPFETHQHIKIKLIVASVSG